jgi:ribokinase
MKKFCVLGSINMDMVTRVQRFPLPGETIIGSSFTIFPGGKGANQAVALGRLGCAVEMVGAIGDDMLGARYRSEFESGGIGCSGIQTAPQTATGTASIEVNGQGENHIIVVPAANATVTPAFVRAHRSYIETADFLLMQLEIPLDSVLEAAKIASEKHCTLILDPAPAVPLNEELYRYISIITPNETEAALLTGEDTGTEDGMIRAGKILLSRGVRTVIIKAGKRGAFLIEGDRARLIAGFPVKAIDTVAAGDSFNAGLACALGNESPMEEAVRFANAVAAISTTREGAQSAMPGYEEAVNLMKPKN